MRWSFRALLLAAMAPLLGGCPPESTIPLGVQVPTGISVDPEVFLGSVECSPRPGGMNSFVATLIDVSNPDDPFFLASSPPQTCAVPTDFQYLVVDHIYVAEVDGYEALPQALVPINGGASGSRHMLLDNEPIAPRWTGSCAEATAVTDNDVKISPCTPLRDLQGAVTTGIEVEPTSTLGDHFRCGDDGGIVSSFTITSDDKTLAKQLPQPCTSSPLPQWFYDVGVQGGRGYGFSIKAFDDEHALLGTARCFASTHEGLVVLAVCEELNP